MKKTLLIFFRFLLLKLFDTCSNFDKIGTKTQRKETKTIKITRIKSEEKAESKGTKEEKKLTERIENQTQTIEAVLWA